MRTIKNIFYVTAEKESNKEIDFAGGKLYIETDFRPYHVAVVKAKILSTPYTIDKSQRNDIKLNVGDEVYVHHFVVQPDNLTIVDGVECYQAEYFSIYCKIEEGEIVMLEDWIFVSPILESEENYKTASGLWLKPDAENLPLQAKIEHIHPSLEARGLKKGDHIIFTPDSEYEIRVEGKDYWRMKFEYIAGVLRDGIIVPVKGKIIVNQEKLNDTTSSGIIIPQTAMNRIHRMVTGEVKSTASEYVTPGDNIIYAKASAMDFEYTGKIFTMVLEKDILAIVE